MKAFFFMFYALSSARPEFHRGDPPEKQLGSFCSAQKLCWPETGEIVCVGGNMKDPKTWWPISKNSSKHKVIGRCTRCSVLCDYKPYKLGCRSRQHSPVDYCGLCVPKTFDKKGKFRKICKFLCVRHGKTHQCTHKCRTGGVCSSGHCMNWMKKPHKPIEPGEDGYCQIDTVEKQLSRAQTCPDTAECNDGCPCLAKDGVCTVGHPQTPAAWRMRKTEKTGVCRDCDTLCDYHGTNIYCSLVGAFGTEYCGTCEPKKFDTKGLFKKFCRTHCVRHGRSGKCTYKCHNQRDCQSGHCLDWMRDTHKDIKIGQIGYCKGRHLLFEKNSVNMYKERMKGILR